MQPASLVYLHFLPFDWSHEPVKTCIVIFQLQSKDPVTGDTVKGPDENFWLRPRSSSSIMKSHQLDPAGGIVV